MILPEMFNLALQITQDLRASSPYRTGAMRSSIALVQVDENYIDIVVAVPYASYVNQKGVHQGWIERVVETTCRAYSSNNNVEGLTGLTGIITYGE